MPESGLGSVAKDITIKNAKATTQNPDHRFPVADCCARTSEAATHLPDLHAAVDNQVDARDVRALVGDKVERRVGDVFGRAETSEEGPRCHPVAELSIIPRTFR